MLIVCQLKLNVRRMQGVEIDSLREGQQDLSRNGSSGA